MKKIKSRWLALLAALMITLGGSAWAFNLGDLIGVIGGGFVVSAIAGPINDFINTITLNRGAKVEGHTKVVPIVSIGSGTHIGAAQVAGPRGDAITSTKAVAQIEGDVHGRCG